MSKKRAPKWLSKIITSQPCVINPTPLVGPTGVSECHVDWQSWKATLPPTEGAFLLTPNIKGF